MTFDFEEHMRKKKAKAARALRGALGPPKKTMFGDPPPARSQWLGSVVERKMALAAKHNVPLIGNEDEFKYAYRIYDATLAISLGNRELADEAFQRARIHYRKEKHALQAAVHEGGTADGVGEGKDADNEPKPA